MTSGSDFADDLKNEVLCEMADNFFSRRCRLDERLENFEALRARVRKRAEPALKHILALRHLLLDSPKADAFLTGLGLDPTWLTAEAGTIRKFTRPLALTAAGRYRKAVNRAYATMRQEIAQYNEGGFAPDPRQPGRMVPIPGYNHLHGVVDKINAEIEAVNASHCPSELIRFNKSLDPDRLEQEYTCGSIGDSSRLNNDLAFVPLDPNVLNVPRLPTPPPLDDMAEALNALADAVRQDNPQAADAAYG